MVMGIETEYGIALVDAVSPARPANPVELSTRLVAAYKATQGSRLAPWDYQSEDPLADARGFHLERAAARPSQLTNAPSVQRAASRRAGGGAALLANGARLYVDHAHPEYATPEVVSASEAALWDKAGELVMWRAVQALRADGGPDVAIFKNNTDGKGASYGTHENYLVDRAVPWTELVAALTPYLVTRQILTGSGRVGLGPSGADAGFQLSQRADYVEAEVGLETTMNRPIINTRDEPHADPARWRRLHVIVGDATVLEVATWLRLGMMQLVLGALEAGLLGRQFVEQVALAQPVAAFWQVSRDLTLGQPLELASGATATALEIQRCYWAAVASLPSSVDPPMANSGLPARQSQAISGHPARQSQAISGHPARQSQGPDAVRSEGGVLQHNLSVAQQWGRLLDLLDGGDRPAASRQIEWLAKHQLLDGLRHRGHLSWDNPRLLAADLRWADIDPERSLAQRVVAGGLVDCLFTDQQVAAAVDQPPGSTRAWIKSQAVARLGEQVTAAGWDSLSVTGPDGPVRLMLPDPLAGNRASLGPALEGDFTASALIKALLGQP